MGNTIESNIIGLNETVKASQNNFLLKGYFNKKKKSEAKKKEEIEKIKDNKNTIITK